MWLRSSAEKLIRKKRGPRTHIRHERSGTRHDMGEMLQQVVGATQGAVSGGGGRTKMHASATSKFERRYESARIAHFAAAARAGRHRAQWPGRVHAVRSAASHGQLSPCVRVRQTRARLCRRPQGSVPACDARRQDAAVSIVDQRVFPTSTAGAIIAAIRCGK